MGETTKTRMDTETVARLRLALMRLARRLRQEAQAEQRMSPSTLSALASIERNGPLTLGALAEAEKVTPPTITRVVARLEEEGLIARAADPTDKRIALVSITDTGRTLLERARARQSEALQRRIDALDLDDPDALEETARLLERILEVDA